MTGSAPRRDRRQAVLARSIGFVVLVTLGAACSTADETELQLPDAPAVDSGGPVDSGETVDTVPDDSVADEAPSDSAPDASPPDDTSVEDPEEQGPGDSIPPTSAPGESPETSEPPDELDPPDGEEPTDGEPDDDVDPALVASAVAGFLLLVGVAAWWMLRRDDPDADVGRHDWPDEQMSV